MPIYEYQCSDCGAVFSALLRTFGSAEPNSCAYCGGQAIAKMMSSFTAITEGGAPDLVDEPVGPAKPPPFGRQELKKALERKSTRAGSN